MACRGRAGMGRCADATPGGRCDVMARRRQLTAKARTSRSSRSLSACRAPRQKTPTPVGWPSSGVASRATRSAGAVAGPEGPAFEGDPLGTRGALHTA